MPQTNLIPQKYRVLSGSVLKLIAVVSMLIDHTAAVLLGQSHIFLLRVGRSSIELYTVMRFVGRLAFPIYAFLLVEGFLHTHDRKKYGVRLFLFALLSELPWNLEHTGTWHYVGQNVFFTLLLGYLGLCAVERMKAPEAKRGRCAAMLFGLLAVSAVLRADYGCSGYGFIIMLYLLREQPLYQALVGSCFLSSRWQAGLAFIPINLYNGERGFIRGRFLQLAFYALYPLHMLLLYCIRLRTIGY